MPEQIEITVNGTPVRVPVGTTAAVAILISNIFCRTSVRGEPRGPLCGMGICFECRAEIDGIAHRRSCQILCAAGMKISTDLRQDV
ncbi:MAG: (2Fe-2S)-binding protein [Acidobacteria bacterium]|nr:(2Fe-2S)-binding protein [Acidobacteriota bacterium]MBV9624151.1 (2Fe-2S)-binding protein [Acidobacteriota bacterium]